MWQMEAWQRKRSATDLTPFRSNKFAAQQGRRLADSKLDRMSLSPQGVGKKLHGSKLLSATCPLGSYDDDQESWESWNFAADYQLAG